MGVARWELQHLVASYQHAYQVVEEADQWCHSRSPMVDATAEREDRTDGSRLMGLTSASAPDAGSVSRLVIIRMGEPWHINGANDGSRRRN